MSVRAATTLLLMLALCACREASVPETPPAAELPDTAEPLRYRLALTIDPELPRFQGAAEIDVRLKAPSEWLWIHANGLDVERVTVIDAGRSIELDSANFEQVTDDGVAKLVFDRTLAPGDYTLVFDYSAPFGEDLSGLYRVRAGERWYAITQFEDIAARDAFPAFDEPRFKTPFDIRVVAPAGNTVAGPTLPRADDMVDGRREVTFATTPPLPTYLIALAVGPYDLVTYQEIPASELRPTPIPLRGLAVAGRGAELDAALAGTAGLLLEHERYYGIAYPFTKLDIAAVPDFQAGAMENVGLITFRDEFLLIGDRPTAEQRRDYVGIHSHEIAHQWFGNLVTPSWWNDIWLNESFASWAGARAAHALEPDEGHRTGELFGTLNAMDHDSLAAARRLREPVESSGDIINAFDPITYSKGAGVLRMFEGYMGADGFRAAVRGYLERFRNGTATADDFIDALADSAHAPDIGEAFRSFIDRPGVPAIDVDVVCRAGGAELNLTVHRYQPLGAIGDQVSGWKVPFCIRYADGAESAKPRDACTMLTAGEQRLDLDTCPTWLLPNRNGDGYYRWSLDERAFARLLAHYTELETDEQLVVVDSLTSAFASGRVDVAELLDALPAVARSRDAYTIERVLGRLGWLHEQAGDVARGTLERRYRDAFAERRRQALEASGGSPGGSRGSPGGSRGSRDDRLVDTLTEFLALYGGDADIRAELSTKATAYLARARAKELERAGAKQDLPHWEQLDVGLEAALESGRIDATALVDSLPSIDRSEIRRAILLALGRADVAAANAAARELVGSDLLRHNERIEVLVALFQPQGTDDVWKWFTTNLDAWSGKIPEGDRQYLPALASGFCTVEHARDVDAFFRGRAADFRGSERVLAQAAEAIGQCAAQRARHAPALEALAEASGL